MTDPGLRNHLYSEAERTVQELSNSGVISPQGHGDIMRILQTERNGSYNGSASFNQGQAYSQPYQQSYSAPQTGYYDHQPVQGVPYNNAYPLQQGGYMTPVTMGPQQSLPPPQQPAKQDIQPAPAPAPANPPPEAHHSSSGLGKFGKRMGDNVTNGLSSGFGLQMGSNVANSLWHKL